MSFIFKCPHCNAMLEQEDSWEGLDSQCAVCGKDIHIVRQTAAAPVIQRSGTSDTVKIVLLLALLIVAVIGVAVFYFREDLGLGSSANSASTAEQQANMDAQLRQKEEAENKKRQEIIAKAQKDAEAKDKAEKVRQARSAQAINDAISNAEKEAASKTSDAAKERTNLQTRNKQAQETFQNAIKEREAAAKYQEAQKARKARSIISPVTPLNVLPLNWLDSVEICQNNIKSLISCGNDFYVATIGNEELFLQFSNNKLVAICYPCTEETFRNTVALLHTATGKYGKEYGKLITQWEVDSSSSVVIAQAITLLNMNDYSICCVYSDYYPIYSQKCLDSVAAAINNTNNFTIAREALNTAINSYPAAIAKNKTKELVQKLNDAETKWNDNLRKKLSSEYITSTDNRDIDDVISEVLSTYQYPGNTATYIPR